MMATNRKFIKNRCRIFKVTHSVESELKSTTKAVSYDMNDINIASDIGDAEKNAADGDQCVVSEFSKSYDHNLGIERFAALSLPHQSH
eukprot:UN13670